MKMIRKLAVRWWGVGLVLLLCGMTVILYFTFRAVSPVDANRALWESQGITSYRIRLSTLVLPSPVVTRDVIVEGNETAEPEPVPCPNVEYRPCPSTAIMPPIYIAPADMSRATIDDLFSQAEACTHRTISLLDQCAAFAPYASTGFGNSDDMHAISRRCFGDEVDLSVVLCTVEYHPVYGFPTLIHHYIPNAIDGAGIVVVDEFEVLE